MNTSYLVDEPRRIRLWRRLAWPWAAFWLLMLAVGMQGYLWSGGHRFWQRFVDTVRPRW
jgi:two-component system, LytTR family, sensor kinase